VLLLSGALALAATASDDGKAARRSVYPEELPAGPGHDIAERSCLMCHAATLITQQAKDSVGWEKTLATMEKWSAPVPAVERDTLRDYLLAHFGPRPPK
jgi:hypothetical protein